MRLNAAICARRGVARAPAALAAQRAVDEGYDPTRRVAQGFRVRLEGGARQHSAAMHVSHAHSATHARSSSARRGAACGGSAPRLPRQTCRAQTAGFPPLLPPPPRRAAAAASRVRRGVQQGDAARATVCFVPIAMCRLAARASRLRRIFAHSSANMSSYRTFWGQDVPKGAGVAVAIPGDADRLNVSQVRRRGSSRARRARHAACAACTQRGARRAARDAAPAAPHGAPPAPCADFACRPPRARLRWAPLSRPASA